MQNGLELKIKKGATENLRPPPSVLAYLNRRLSVQISDIQKAKMQY